MIFIQGDPADGLFYIQKAKVKLTVAIDWGIPRPEWNRP
jgi:hypothetical protein